MEIWVAILGILVGAIGCYVLDRKRKGELEALRKEKADLSAKLTKAEEEKGDSETQLNEARTEIGSLTEQVNVANRQISSLTGQVNEARTEISNLTEQVNVANRQIGNLTTQLREVSAGNENALQLLHLFELSLQLTAFALYSEMSRAKHLDVENREFNAAYKNLRETYENLHAEYKDIFGTYADFREQVERKAKRRLVQSTVGAALSLIPGVGAIQLVADLIELADFASDLSEDTADFCDLLSVAELYITSSNVLEDFVDYKSIKSLRPDISSDQDRERVKQEYQTVFKEVFMENLDQDDKEPDASDIDHFLTTIVQRMKDLVASAPEGARRNALRNTVNKFKQFGISSYPNHESSSMDVDRSLPVSKD